MIIRIFKPLFFLPVLFFCFTATGFSDEFSESFITGIKYYRAQNYTEAISEFTKITDSGIKNGKLFYNLANAYMKNGNLGKAVLWYERAYKLIPGDPDLQFNMEYASMQLKDAPEERGSQVIKIIFFWKFILKIPAVQWTAIALNIIFWLILCIRIIQKSIIQKKRIFKLPVYCIMFFAIIFISTAFYNYYESLTIKQAVIIHEKVSVRSGFAKKSTELFVLHEGTKIRVEKEQKDFYKIIFSKEKIGWIKKSEAEPV